MKPLSSKYPQVPHDSSQVQSGFTMPGRCNKSNRRPHQHSQLAVKASRRTAASFASRIVLDRREKDKCVRVEPSESSCL